MTIEEQKELKARENELKEQAVIERKRKLETKRQSWVRELTNKTPFFIGGSKLLYKIWPPK